MDTMAGPCKHRFVVLGNSGVGKAALIQRAIYGQYNVSTITDIQRDVLQLTGKDNIITSTGADAGFFKGGGGQT